MSEQPMRETPDAVKAFEEYYDLGDGRSLDLLAQQRYQRQAKPKPTVPTILSRLKVWSSAHHWQDRLVQREQEEAEKARKKRTRQVEKMNERHILIGTTQQAKAIKQIEALIEAKKFGSQATMQLLKLATDLERLALGAATERTELTGKDGGPLDTHTTLSIDVTKLRDATPEQIATLKALALELKAKEQE